MAVLGRNGCGKSTLAKHCNAIALPAGGTVTVFGMDTQDEGNLIPIRRTVGMVFQNPDNQIVANVVEEDVAFAPENLGGALSGDPAACGRGPAPGGPVRVSGACSPSPLRWAKSSGWPLQESLPCGPSALSWTNLRRCWTLGDGEEVMEIVSDLNRRLGITVVLITHHMDEAARAQRVVVLDRGEIAADGPPKRSSARWSCCTAWACLPRRLWSCAGS